MTWLHLHLQAVLWLWALLKQGDTQGGDRLRGRLLSWRSFQRLRLALKALLLPLLLSLRSHCFH